MPSHSQDQEEISPPLMGRMVGVWRWARVDGSFCECRLGTPVSRTGCSPPISTGIVVRHTSNCRMLKRYATLRTTNIGTRGTLARKLDEVNLLSLCFKSCGRTNMKSSEGDIRNIVRFLWAGALKLLNVHWHIVLSLIYIHVITRSTSISPPCFIPPPTLPSVDHFYHHDPSLPRKRLP